MKKLGSVILLTLFVVFAVQAAPKVEYGYFNAKSSGWKKNAEAFINSHKPEPGNVSGGISGEYDLHIWVIAGNSDEHYEITSYHTGKTPDWLKVTKSLIRGGAVVLGFSGPDILLVNVK